MDGKTYRYESKKGRAAERRGACLRSPILLCLVLALSLTVGSAARAADAVIRPSLPSATKPIVTVEGNAVIKKDIATPTAVDLTGFFEVAVKVQTTTYYKKAGGNTTAPASKADYETEQAAIKTTPGTPQTIFPQDVPFNAVDVALNYDAEVLTPVKWTADPALIFDAATGDVKKDALGYAAGVVDTTGSTVAKPAELDTVKYDSGILANAQVVVLPAVGGKHAAGILAISAGVQMKGLSFAEETAIVTVRFAYNKEKYPMLEKNVIDSVVCVQGTDAVVTDSTANTDAEKWGLAGTKTFKHSVLWFATDEQAAASIAGQSVWFKSREPKTNSYMEFYYYQKSDATDGTDIAPAPNNTETVTTDITFGGVNTYTVPRPNTAGKKVLSQAADGSAAPDFTTNRLSVTGKSVVFKLVNRVTCYGGGAAGVGGISVVFLDWDDSVLGIRVFDKNDVRAEVNSYVESTFIHPDLRASTHAGADYTDSLSREFTYRGSYPSVAGGGGVTAPDGGTNPGSGFPLTNKLDYAFYKRVNLEYKDTVAASGTGTGAVPAHDDFYHAVQKVSAATASGDNAFPYVHGWAVVDNINKADTVWTTFGVGELKDADPAYADDAAHTPQYVPTAAKLPDGTAASATTEYSYKTSTADASGYFHFVDFSDLGANIKDGKEVLVVKAVYEPGKSLLKDYQYSVVDGPTYQRYSLSGSTANATYSVQYQYARATQNAGQWYGVDRTRDPAVQVKVMSDTMKNAIVNNDQNYFISTTPVENLDRMNTDITVSGEVWGMDYTLVDTFEKNIATGSQRSKLNNEMNVPRNFDYEFEKTTVLADKYAHRLGTKGLVFQATLNTVLAEGTKEARQKPNSYTNHVNVDTIKDLNLRSDANGTEFTALDYTTARTDILDAITKAVAKGNVDANGNALLEYHQLQYHIIHFATGGAFKADGTLMTPTECGAFAWCRQDTCGGGATLITNLQELLEAGFKVYDGSMPTALNALTLDNVNALFLRANLGGTAFADLTTFKTALANAMTGLATHYTSANIGTATWKELQYALINGTYAADATIKENYWWAGGNTPDILTLGDLLAADYEYVVNGADKSILNKLTDKFVKDNYLRMNAAGAGFATLEDFKTALHAATTTLKTNGFTATTIKNVNWIVVQHLLIHSADYRTEAALRADVTIDYWWENGGSPSVTDLKSLLKVGYLVHVGGGDGAMLGGITNTIVDSLYLRATVGGGKFAGVSDFKTAFAAAMTALGAHYTDKTIETATWKELQYALIHGTYLADAAITEDYWWQGGGSPAITTVGALADLAYQFYVGGGDAGLLGNLTEKVVSDFYLRKDINGFPFANVSVFKVALQTAVTALTTAPGPYTGTTVKNVTWEELQYALINGTYGTGIGAGYWWKGGGVKPIATVQDLLIAAYAAYGATPAQPGALDGLPAPTVLAGAPFWLRSEKDNGTAYATAADVKAALQVAVATMITGRIDASTVGSVTWKQLQHFMLGNAFDADAGITANYWWYNGGTKPAIDPEPIIAEIMTEAVNASVEMGGAGSSAEMTNLLGKYAATLAFRDAGGATLDATALEPKLFEIVSAVFGAWDVNFIDEGTGYIVISWNEIQYYLITGAFATDESGTIPSATYTWRPGGAKSLAMPLEIQRPADPMETPDPLPEPTVPEPPASSPGFPPEETVGDPPATMEEVKGEAAMVLTSATPASVTPRLEEPVMAAPATAAPATAAPATAAADPGTTPAAVFKAAAPKAAASDQTAPKTATSPAAFAAAAPKTATTPAAPPAKSPPQVVRWVLAKVTTLAHQICDSLSPGIGRILDALPLPNERYSSRKLRMKSLAPAI